MRSGRKATRSASQRLLWGACAACLLALGLALVAQHVFDLRPCPWCVLQRGIYLLLAAVFAIAASLHGVARSLAVLVGLLLSAGGIASALYQHLVAAQQFSCGLSWPDKLMSSLGLDAALPSVFSATASCAEAAVSVFGVPFAFWSLGLFSLLGLCCVGLLLRRRA